MRSSFICVLWASTVLAFGCGSVAEAKTFTRILEPEVTVTTTGHAHSGWTVDVVGGKFEWQARGDAPGGPNGQVKLKFIEPPEVI